VGFTYCFEYKVARPQIAEKGRVPRFFIAKNSKKVYKTAKTVKNMVKFTIQKCGS